MSDRHANAVSTTIPDLLIVGASARACAFSARMAGLVPVCFDQFADADLQAVADVRRVKRYPADLPIMAEEFPGVPWMYTGALENYPAIVAKISETHPLIGNSPDVLHKIRDPILLARWLTESGMNSLAVRPGDDAPPADGSWLIKPRRSAAGIGIHIWNETVCHSIPDRRTDSFYFQEYCSGESHSALFTGDARSARLLGMTRQLVGCHELNAIDFAYSGSIGVIPCEPIIRESIEQLGQLLVERSGMSGLFGCDLIVDERGIWLTEVNPRYTASAEIIERATGQSTICEHLLGCRSVQPELERLPLFERTSHEHLPNTKNRFSKFDEPMIYGKAILYSIREFIMPDLSELSSPFQSPLETSRWPAFADIPVPGTRIEQGHPICTLFASATAVSDCQSRLFQIACDLTEVLAKSSR
ncbi:MAG: ATP-grasp domain-containing protein [Planctomycetaceae bacterium]